MKKLFTIGYGGLRPAEFVSRLREAGVRTVVDVAEYLSTTQGFRVEHL